MLKPKKAFGKLVAGARLQQYQRTFSLGLSEGL
jgi:hypothetical protein